MNNEATTRTDLIDKKLELAGWNPNDPQGVIREFRVTGKTKGTIAEPAVDYMLQAEYADYVLCGRDGKPLAVVEAKKSSVDASTGREQAKQYCHNIQAQTGGELPFCFYTNGHDIYFWDLENYPPRKVYGFPTRDDLERYRYIRKARKPLAEELINTKIAGRDYQVQAIRSVLESIERRKRKFLLVMATGTGKTRTCIALVDALMRAGWAERTLFLVDRIALRDQALDAFKEHLPDEPRWPRPGEKTITSDRRIYVVTYPTMLNNIRDESSRLSPHFFDLVVVDESHRSIYNTYREILDYFSATTIGLTATPTDAIDHNTFQLFDCEDGLPGFAFSYQEAIEHQPPYLCDFRVMKIRTRFQQEGISKRTISLEEQKKLLQQGQDVAEINYEGSELEKTVTNRGTNALIVREFMEECIKDQNGVLPGKTIFFCMSVAHARRIEEIFDSLYPEYKGELAKVIVSDDARTHGKGGLIDQFKNNDMPRIAISVDMLDTGIDVREIVNLVFAKPVYSYTKFWQMIGRGTRLLERDKIKPWCMEKDNFLILDCWDNFDYFNLNPTGKPISSQLPLPVRLFGLRLDKVEKALELGRDDIPTRETEYLHAMTNALPPSSVVVMDAQTELQRLAESGFWDVLNVEKLEFLRSIVKPLMRTISTVDFRAMRFEKDVVEVSLAHLSNEIAKFEALKESIIEEIAGLPLSIRSVAEQEALIRQAQTNHYWATITEEKLDELITKLAPLMKYRDVVVPPMRMAHFNIKDFLHSKEEVEFGPQHESVNIGRYREMVEERVKALSESNPLLRKIQAGGELTESEQEILAEQLHNEHPHITVDLLRRVYSHRRAQFLQFIRHILGLEVLESFPETVAKALDEFIAAHSYLNSRQLQFLDLLRDFLIERGELQKKDLIQAPFTLLHPEGIRGVFSPREIEEILTLTQRIAA